MTAALRRLAQERAAGQCEYCGLSRERSVLSFHVEHIVPRQHGGESVAENLALACPHCNLRKGPNLTGIDPDTGKLCRLFNPRNDLWNDHFRRNGATITGLTDVGRTTVFVLDLNAEDQLRLRGIISP
jgi:hypothetical protein